MQLSFRETNIGNRHFSYGIILRIEFCDRTKIYPFFTIKPLLLDESFLKDLHPAEQTENEIKKARV